MQTDALDARLGLLVLAWLLYFGVHSMLASLPLKRWVARTRPRWMPGYRLFFNLCALVLLVPPLVLTYAQRGPWLWQWSGLAWWLANGVAVASLVGLAWSLRWYDATEFLGLRQWRIGLRTPEDQEGFRISPLHRYVRHPWYSLGLVLLWTRDMDPPFLTTAILVTLYLVLGSRLEERKLLVYHGDVYRAYRRMVPPLLPSPRRYLGPGQALELAALAARARPARGGSAPPRENP